MERAAFLIEATGGRIDCLVNPEAIVFRREAGIHRRRLVGELIGDSGWSDDALVCGGGGLTELQLDLLFDSSLVPPPAECDDVQTLTRPFWELAEHSLGADGHYRPHFVNVIWGKAFNVRGVVAAVAERFECFSPNGAPQRSWLRMRFIRVDDRTREQGTDEARDIGRESSGAAPLLLDAGTPTSLRGDSRESDDALATLTRDIGLPEAFAHDAINAEENG